MPTPKTIFGLLAAGLISALATLAIRAENEIGFIEKFALSADREATLAQLVPGTEEYYFFHALQYQTTGQRPKLAAILEQWAKRYPNSDQRRILENREALLGYDANPQKTLQFLRDRLGLRFDHVQEVRDRKPDLPVALDPARISRDVFLREVLVHDGLAGVADPDIDRLVRDRVALRPAQRRTVLSKLVRPDVPGLVELVAEDLKTQESRGFGEFAIHRALLPEQLDALQHLVPSIAGQQAFVFARIRKLAPGADADAAQDPVVREAWLGRVWDSIRTLPAGFNSLKAHVLYTRLVHDRTRGIYNRERFVEYLKLPRPVHYMNPKYLEQADVARHAVDLNAAFDETGLGLSAIGNDEALVRDFVLHFSVDDAAWEPWTEWLQDAWVKPIFAEAKITAGVGDPEKWASLLSPAAYQALKNRVDIDFPPTNPASVPVDGEVSVSVVVKNAPKVIVRIYEVNTLGYFLAQKRQLNTDLSLDGLVANSERTHDGETSPFKRVVREFTFPELKGKRGAWVLEFIGGGRSSRALVRKGSFSLVQKPGAAGDLLTVLDENRKATTNVVAWLDGRRLTPDPKDGRILVPFTAQPGRRAIVLADPSGAFASLAEFDHHAEDYQLDAQFHIEREQLLARRDATLAVRTVLLVGSLAAAPELLLEPTLSITTETIDGISTTTETKIAGLTAGRDLTNTFRVPDRLARITATLRGKVDQLSRGGEKKDLVASRTWELNGIDRTEATNDGHLSRFGEEHVFELLGKNGEPVADQQVVFEVVRRGFTKAETIPLRTDDQGRVALGRLEDVATVRARVPNGRQSTWNLEEAARTWPTELHARAGETIRVPWIANARPESVSLLEVRGGEFVADRSGSAKQNGAFLELSGLAPGDYSLRLRDEEDRTIAIRITDGQPVGEWLVGANRSLEVRDGAPLQVESASVTTNGVVVQLRNWNQYTRVHVAATRFLPGRGLFGGLGGFTRFGSGWATPDRLPNLYSGGRAIGDEYRYILERRYAAKYPGNMLVRPGLLLNPWEKRSTDANTLAMDAMVPPAMAAGTRFGLVGGASQMAAAPPPPGAGGEDTTLDFLADAAPVVYNLVPDAAGVVRLPFQSLGDRQHVQIYAEDPFHAAWETLALGERVTRFRDLRLSRNLDPAQSSTEAKEIVVLAKGGTATLPDGLTGEIETYDALASVHALFTTLNPDANLAKFEWIVRWPSLKDAEKRSKYSEFACHELNLFLSRKDKKFFAEVIQPYLRNKKDRTFLDEYLLESDLKRYLEPWAYAQLNVAERALLARRLPEESANAARHLRELWELLPPNPEEDERLFETALRGRALETAPTEAGGLPGGAGRRLILERESVNRGLATNGHVDQLAISTLGVAFKSAVVGPAGLSKGDTRFARSAAMRGLGRAAVGGLNADRSKGEGLLDEKLKQAEKDKREEGTADLFLAKPASVVDFDAAGLREQRSAASANAYYRLLGPTKEWAENNYYRLPIEAQGPELVAINGFWRDFAAWDGRTPFLSPHLAEAHHNFTEMMLALAVLDLPFEAPAHATKTEGNAFTFTAGGPVIVFLKQFRTTDRPAADAAAGLLVSEGFYRQGDRFFQEGNEKRDKFVADEFLSGVVYGAHVVVSNPGSSPLKLDLLTQVPRGAMPVLGSKATQSRQIRLEPYTTQQIEYHFYFPQPPTNAVPYPHFPSSVAVAGKSAGTAKPLSFRVVRQLSRVDTASWDYISQQGSDAEVFTFLEQNNLARLDLERIAWRARGSVDFFRRLVAFLGQHHVWNEPVYRYAVLHNEPSLLREWLRHRDDFLSQCGPWIDTRLARIDPVERKTYEHLEYLPLVNQRAHRVGAEDKIPNPVLREQYNRLLWILAYRPTLDAADQLSAVYSLFLQDRVEEALARFHTIKADDVRTRLQYDYLRCYAAFYEEKGAEARAIAARYADYPVDRWRSLFAEVVAQFDEAEGKAVARAGGIPDRDKRQAELARAEPTFDFKVENRTLSLTWRNLSEVTVNYYLMDPEFLFSSSPFVARDADRFGIIKPTLSAVLPLPVGKDTLDIALPAQFARANVLVEVLGAGQRSAHAYHANTFKLTLAESYGRLEVREQGTDKPVSKAYIKVYARLVDGSVRFLKDGYTDLRGKFDYASINGGEVPALATKSESGSTESSAAGIDHPMLRPDEVGRVERMAVLVLSDTHGAAVREVDAPRR